MTSEPLPMAVERSGEEFVKKEVEVPVQGSADETVDMGKPAGVEEVTAADEVLTAIETAAKDEGTLGGGSALVGRKLKKRFGRKFFKGEVKGWDQGDLWYHIEYEDGDTEDLHWKELEPLLVDSHESGTPQKQKKRQGQQKLSTRTSKRRSKDAEEAPEEETVAGTPDDVKKPVLNTAKEEVPLVEAGEIEQAALGKPDIQTEIGTSLVEKALAELTQVNKLLVSETGVAADAEGGAGMEIEQATDRKDEGLIEGTESKAGPLEAAQEIPKPKRRGRPPKISAVRKDEEGSGPPGAEPLLEKKRGRPSKDGGQSEGTPVQTSTNGGVAVPIEQVPGKKKVPMGRGKRNKKAAKVYTDTDVVHSKKKPAPRDSAFDDAVKKAAKQPGPGKALVGSKVWKEFNGVLYEGMVQRFSPTSFFYRVLYTDGDLEDLDWEELQTVLSPQGTARLATEARGNEAEALTFGKNLTSPEVLPGTTEGTIEGNCSKGNSIPHKEVAREGTTSPLEGTSGDGGASGKEADVAAAPPLKSNTAGEGACPLEGAGGDGESVGKETIPPGSPEKASNIREGSSALEGASGDDKAIGKDAIIAPAPPDENLAAPAADESVSLEPGKGS
eukprot:jgi/Mesen1/9965/ME000072S09375